MSVKNKGVVFITSGGNEFILSGFYDELVTNAVGKFERIYPFKL